MLAPQRSGRTGVQLPMINASKLFRPAALIGAAALATLAAAPALAQGPAQEESPRGWTVTLGPGAQAYPEYPGADSYGIRPLFLVGLRRAGTRMPFEALDDSIG